MKIYADTNLYVDSWRKYDSKYLHYTWAQEFFAKGYEGKFTLVYSNWLLKELRKHLSENEIQDILKVKSYKYNG